MTYGYDTITTEDTPDDRPLIPDTRRDEDTVLNLWFRSDTWTVYDKVAYKLSSTPSDELTYAELTSDNLYNFSVSFRFYRVDVFGEEMIADDVAKVTRVGAGAGIVQVAYETPDIMWNINDALMIQVLFSLNNSEPTVKAQFITQPLETDLITANTWTVYYYTSISESYSYKVYWGTAGTQIIKITNFQYSALDPWGMGSYLLGEGDFVGFVLNPFTFYLGDIFYALLLMGLCIPAYNRYRSIMPVLILMLVFGGVGGVLSSIIPAVGLNISFIFLAIGVALVFYKLIRRD